MPINLEKIDLGSFGVSEPAAQPEQQPLDFDLQPNTELRATVDEAFKINPDQHARINKLSNESGVPTFAVESNPEDVEHGLKLDQIDFDQMSKRSPNTAKYLTDFNNAVIAQDDIDVLQTIEDIFDFGKTFENIGESIKLGFSSQAKGLEAAAVDSTPERIFDLVPIDALPIGLEHMAPQISQQIASNFDIETDEQLQVVKEEATTRIISELVELQEQRQAITPEDMNILEQGVRAGVESLANMAPGFGLMVLSGGRAAPLLTTIGVQTFGASYGDARAEGLDPEQATWFAGIDAAIEVGTELLPTKTLETIITGGSTGLKKDALKFMVREMGTEQLATLGQSINSFAFGLDEQMEQAETVEEMVQIQLQRQAVTAIATIVAGGAQAAAATAIRKSIEAVTSDAQKQEDKGAVEQKKIDQLNAASEASKLKQRDSESFKQFVEEADGTNNTQVYIDGAQSSLYLQSKTPEEIEADPALKLIADQVQEAARLGGDVVIPVADFATDIAATPHYEALRPHMTLSGETASPFRQEQVQEETQNYVKTLLDEAQENASEFVEAQDIFESVRTQLIDTGTVTPQNASIMSQLVPAWATVYAKKNGISVAEAYAQSDLTIEGPQTGKAAEFAEDVLTQPTQTIEEFADAVTELQGLEDFFLIEKGTGDIELANFVVSRDDQGQGKGTQAMEQLIQFADQRGQRLVLTPALPDDRKGTTSRARLVKFYKRFGFVENKGRNKDFTVSGGMYREPHPVEQFRQAEIDLTQTEEFKRWSGDGEVVESEDINDHEFKADTPTVVRVFHGTTHKFSVFDALRGNLEGQFGAVNYFTSSEQDATDNYAGEGPDLTNRINQRAEQLEDEIQDVIDDDGLEAAVERFIPDADQFIEDASDIAQVLAKSELSGGQDQTMELFVRVDNPFVIGENTSWIEFIDDEAVQTEAIERVAEENDTSVEEVNENIEDFEDQIDEIRWELQGEQEHPLIEAIQTVSDRHDIEASNLAAEVYDLGESAKPEDIEQLLRSSEDYQYADDPETGELIGSQLIAEVIEEMGFDSIILRNAEQRFSTMNIESGTAHVHIFDSGKTNIKSAENIGAFDPTDPDIFQQQTNGKPRTRGFYDPANSVIRLTEAADLSTFLHEFAHFMYEMEVSAKGETLQSINNWYKRNAEAVAKEANTYEPNTIILPRHVNEFLDEGTTGDAERDRGVRRAVHEQFARGFETYLMEGKAPSVELRNAFRSFARWLAEIYRRVRGDLRVNLDNEMRAVLDRMLATEDQIAAAEGRARVEPFFTDADSAGMTEQEFTDYQKRQDKVKGKQSETLRDKLIQEITRKTKKWWKEEKADMVDEELDSLGKQQVYIATNALKTGDIKLDHATVKEMVGEQKVNKLGRTSVVIPTSLRGMTVKGGEGVHPDEAAAMFGYDSGSEMLLDISTAPKIKVQAEINAEKRMNDKHGDILNDGTIEKEADEAVQSEERGQLILHELKMLSRNTSQLSIERQVIKGLAEDRIAKLSFREIHPARYRKAEINAAQEAARMLAEGNQEGAARAKARQALNYYLGMAATEAKNETIKIVDRMSRYNKKKVREEIQKAENGYWEQIVKILNRFEFRKSATLTSVDQINQDINTWSNERIEVDGDGLVLTPAVLNESFVTHWKNVPFSDLQGINDSVKNMEHVARYSNKMTRMEEEQDFNKLVDRWVASMDENATRFTPRRTDVVEGRNWGRWFMSQMTKVPFMASWLDGGERVGISHSIMVQPFTDAYNDEIKLWEKVGSVVAEAINGRDKATRKRHNTKVYIPAIDDSLFVHQVIAVALNTGNQGNLRKLLLGEGWADPEVESEITLQNPKLQAVLGHLRASDWQMVQLIWDQMELLYPQLSEVHRRTTGLVPPKVESTPVETQFGTFRGGYYPVKYDPNRSHQAAINEDKLNAQTESMFSNTASIQASVNTGATNERTGYYGPIRLSLDVVPAHFQETIHYITHHDPVREVNKLVRNKSVTETIKAKIGPEEYAQLKPWLNDIAKDGREAPTKMFWDDLLGKLRFGVTLGTMGFKASTGIIQISGLANTMSEVGAKKTFQGISGAVGQAKWMQAARRILGDTTSIQSAWDFAVENSKVLEHRAQTMDREIKNAMSKIQGKRGMLAAAQEASMKHIALIQTYMVDLPSWHAAYMKGIEEWGDEKRAFEYADWVIENVQGSGATKDLSRIMRNQSETGRMFTMFMTFFSSLWNMERDLVKGAQSGRYSPTNVAAKTMFLFAIPVLFDMLMRGELGEPEDDEDDRLQRMLTGVATYPLQSVPFIRDVVSASTGEYGYNISPLASVIEQGTRTIPAIIERGFTDDEITKAQVKGATKFIGAATGVPGVNQMWATGEHLFEVMEEGEDLTLRELLFGPDR